MHRRFAGCAALTLVAWVIVPGFADAAAGDCRVSRIRCEDVKTQFHAGGSQFATTTKTVKVRSFAIRVDPLRH